MYRLLLITEEFQHVKSRYGNSKITLLIDAFSFPYKAYVASLLAFFCIFAVGIDRNYEVKFNTSLFFAVTIIFLLGKFFDLVSGAVNIYIIKWHNYSCVILEQY